jgi:hypothetical protein
MSEKSEALDRPMQYAVAATFPRRKFQAPPLMIVILIVIVGFLVLTPLFLMILNSFQTARPGQPIVWGIDGWI